MKHALYFLKIFISFNNPMQIQDEKQEHSEKQSTNQQGSPIKLQLNNRPSIVSRPSGGSNISTGFLVNPSNLSRLPQQKMSIESNISGKVQIRTKHSDICEKMIEEFTNEGDFGYLQRASLEEATFQTRPGEFSWVLKPEDGPYRLSNENPIKNEVNQSNAEQKQQSQEQQYTQPIIQPPMQVPQELPPPQKLSCKCLKSKCLLLYCQCFSKSAMCNPSCDCYQCRNSQMFKDKVEKARSAILAKDPDAFSNKLEIIGDSQTNLAYKKGCNCKKTGCIKKYCECFFSGVKCTYLCKCDNCQNGMEKT